ncbi:MULTISPECIES: carbohydrate ABC transporter permease [Microbacterium]|uniref:Carbohydrate ABC transporter permease n=1 Tax=Microbacterium sufflavum TaxID=2851649 RepID=A0ABY4IDS5_9MICO|nr:MULTISPECIES: carbohydrate ABC transporter permease [Microbacterium]MBN6191270.1 carbohydrate ABC transporter permease [Aneurinibacillus sp. BA2021]MCK2025889.1 carbohydrate ABC transporter permease [Microbacterium sufflavum]UPL10719.1 carbohydrate ABC transporter permease [Microbacterium sufflavum]
MTALLQPPTQTAAPTPQPAPRKRRSFRALEPTGWGVVVRWIWLSLAGILSFFPFYAMVVLSLKPGMVVELPGSLLPWTDISFDSYAQVLGGQNILGWLFNTLVYSLVSVVAVLFLSALAGYAFAKKRFRGKEVMFWSFLAMVMVPFHVTLIPTFILMANLGGIDTYWGLILPTLANAQAVFLMRQFIQGLPDELFEAARIDGAGEFRIFLRIVLPLCKPILATLGIFVFLWHWNDFLWPLIIAKSNSMFTLTVGISSLQQQNVPLSTMLAGSVVALLPIFLAYLIAQRYVQEGVTGTGIKG